MTSGANKRPRVLVADDHADLTKAICRLLAEDYEVVGTVADGRAVVETAHRLQPDVVVLDLNFSEIDGLDVCRQITRGHPEIKVIMFTAKDDLETRRESLAAGASAFVCKLSGNLLSALNGVSGSDRGQTT